MRVRARDLLFRQRLPREPALRQGAPSPDHPSPRDTVRARQTHRTGLTRWEGTASESRCRPACLPPSPAGGRVSGIVGTHPENGLLTASCRSFTEARAEAGRKSGHFVPTLNLPPAPWTSCRPLDCPPAPSPRVTETCGEVCVPGAVHSCPRWETGTNMHLCTPGRLLQGGRIPRGCPQGSEGPWWPCLCDL